ncbi:MAG: tetratricopeptide repeat protein, partial [Fimbriimonadales bacterium]
LPLAKSAVELDPDFAMAHLYLARAYEWRGDQGNAERNMSQARQHLDRVTERERYLILATGYEFQGLYEKEAEQYRLLTEVYPDDLEGHRGLADASVWMGRPEDAVPAERRAIALAPHSAIDHQRLILYLNRLNRFSEALQAYTAARANGSRSPLLHWGAGLAELGQDNPAGARQEFELLRKEGGPYEDSLANLSQARVLMYEGRLSEATETLRSGLILDEKLRQDIWIPVSLDLIARLLETRGQQRAAREVVERLSVAALKDLRPGDLRRAGRLMVRVGESKSARKLLERLNALNAQSGGGYTQSCFYNLKGILEMSEGNAKAAIESERRAIVFFPSYDGYAALADALAASHEWPAAAQAYQQYLSRKGEVFGDDSPSDWVLAHLALARVLAKAGDTTQALDFYDEFLRRWAHADPDLLALREARAERTQLSKMLAANTPMAKVIPQAR